MNINLNFNTILFLLKAKNNAFNVQRGLTIVPLNSRQGEPNANAHCDEKRQKNYFNGNDKLKIGESPFMGKQ